MGPLRPEAGVTTGNAAFDDGVGVSQSTPGLHQLCHVQDPRFASDSARGKVPASGSSNNAARGSGYGAVRRVATASFSCALSLQKGYKKNLLGMLSIYYQS
jgi:hypothetical protein